MNAALARTLLALTAVASLPAESFAQACTPAPVIRGDFPDPDVVRHGDTYFAYATNDLKPDPIINVQVASSKDLVNWSAVGEALPTLPKWAVGRLTWAPEVAARPDKRGYVMYFTARDQTSDRQCIGVATATDPGGRFESLAPRPLVCPSGRGGAIDASTYEENGQLHLLWKVDGNCCGLPTPIYLRALRADGLGFARGSKSRLLDRNLGWEGNLIEAPTLWKAEGRYWLFYSANNWDRTGPARESPYVVGYASSAKLHGRYDKRQTPLMGQGADGRGLIGPGGQDIVIGPDGRTWFLYHAWTDQGRSTFADYISWASGEPAVEPRC